MVPVDSVGEDSDRTVRFELKPKSRGSHLESLSNPVAVAADPFFFLALEMEGEAGAESIVETLSLVIHLKVSQGSVLIKLPHPVGTERGAVKWGALNGFVGTPDVVLIEFLVRESDLGLWIGAELEFDVAGLFPVSGHVLNGTGPLAHIAGVAKRIPGYIAELGTDVSFEPVAGLDASFSLGGATGKDAVPVEVEFEIGSLSAQELDGAPDGIGSVEDGCRAFDHFDPLESSRINGGPVLIGAGPKDGVVESDPVDEQDGPEGGESSQVG